MENWFMETRFKQAVATQDWLIPAVSSSTSLTEDEIAADRAKIKTALSTVADVICDVHKTYIIPSS